MILKKPYNYKYGKNGRMNPYSGVDGAPWAFDAYKWCMQHHLTSTTVHRDGRESWLSQALFFLSYNYIQVSIVNFPTLNEDGQHEP